MRLLSFILFLSLVLAQPDWEDTPGAYQFTAAMTAAVYGEDGSILGDVGDMLGAFDIDGNVRGVSSMAEGIGGFTGLTLHAMIIRSNTEGDEISYKYYDASSDSVLSIQESYSFVNGDLTGNLLDPHTLNIGIPPCIDDDSLLAPFDCAYIVDTFSCDLEWGEITVSDACPVTCGTCPVYGCTDTDACNYDPDATLDDGSCGGFDECDVCNGSGPSAGYDCVGTPLDFQFILSTQQAFYFFSNVEINSIAVDYNDWVGAFNGDVCVGARQWDTSQCNGDVCEVPVNGYDGELTSDYMTNGAIPTFKIYDASENTYIDAIPSEDIPWENMGANFLETLMGCSDTTFDECGVCGGGGISEGQCDCVGNVLDCADECGGSAAEDNCGVCDNEPNNNCEQDCDGTWGGSKVLDECGVCGGGGIPEGECDCNSNVYDECGICNGDGPENNYNCAGNCTASLDCTGGCGGSEVVDDCGVCGGDNASCLDCNGDPNGDAYFDPNCGGGISCVGGFTFLTACSQDCAGIWGGTALEDNCGVCDSDASNDCQNDCAGTPGGSAVNDECGICNAYLNTGGFPPPFPYGTCDCNGDPNGGAFFDLSGIFISNCGSGAICVSGNTGLSVCSQDCAGVFGGSAVKDDCNICGGDNSTCTDCNNVINGDAYIDGCGNCVGGNTEAYACPADCAGIEGGTSFMNECEVCVSTVDPTCVQGCNGVWQDNGLHIIIDECGVCGGDNSTCTDCNNVINGDAYIDPHCGGGISCVGGNTIITACSQDCAGVWGGSSLEDNCGVCDLDASNDCQNDCTGTPGGSAVDDECGVCNAYLNTAGVSPSLPYGTCDCNGDPNGEAYIDPNCGGGASCVDGDTGIAACIKDCAGIWDGESVYDECEVCGGNGPEEHYDCDANCIEELDCVGMCGGSVTPTIECQDGNLVCNPVECPSLDINAHMLPDQFGINSIFPNPFNPVTRIQYDISEYSLVKIRVFDTRGREVAQLMNEYQSPGSYNIKWNASHHSSGMYIVAMVIQSKHNTSIFKDMRKILYLK